MTNIPKCPRPTTAGLYLCWRETQTIPELVQIREDRGELFYYGQSIFLLDNLEDNALFYGPITLDY